MTTIIAKYALYPFAQAPSLTFSTLDILVYVKIFKRGEVSAVAFHACIEEASSNSYGFDISSYPVGTTINAKFSLRFPSYSGCKQFSPVNSITGAPPLSLNVLNGHLVYVACNGKPSDSCVLETDGGSRLEIPIIDADGDGTGVGAALIVVVGSGSVELKGTFSQGAIYDLGVGDIPYGIFTMEVEEVPVSNVYIPVYSKEVPCLIISAPPPPI